MNKPAVWKYAWLANFANKKEALDLWNYLLGFGLLATGCYSLWHDQGKNFRKTIENALKIIEAGDKTPNQEKSVWVEVEDNRRVFNPKGITGYWKAYYTAFSCAYYANLAKYEAEIPEEALPPAELNFIPENRESVYREIFTLCETTIEKVFALVPVLERRMKRDAQGPQKELVKSPMNFELQRFGTKAPKRGKTAFDEALERVNEKEGLRVNNLGVEFTKPEDEAVFAIQTLLAETNYRGTDEEREAVPPVNFEGDLPILDITSADWLEAMGLEKKPTPNGLEYVGYDKKEAFEALYSLSMKDFLLSYKTPAKDKNGKPIFDKGGKPRFDVSTMITRLIHYMPTYKDVSSEEAEAILRNQPSKPWDRVRIKVHPIFIQQIENYYVLKPRGLFKEIEARFPRATPKLRLFIHWLFKEVAHKQRGGKAWDWVLPAKTETLQYTLRMEAQITSRKWKVIRETIADVKEKALALGYLEAFDEATVTVNPDKFYDQKKRNPRAIEAEGNP